MTNDRSNAWAAYYEKLRDRPPRRTLVTALDKFGPGSRGALAIDLGCGDGRDVIEMLRRGWRVVAVDAEPGAATPARSAPPARQRSHPRWDSFRGCAAAGWPQPGQFELRHAALRPCSVSEPVAAHRRSAAGRRPIQRPMVRTA